MNKWLSQVLKDLIIKSHSVYTHKPFLPAGPPWMGLSERLLAVLLTVLYLVSGKLPQGPTSYIFQSSLLYVKYTYKQPSRIPRGSYYDRGMLTIYFCLFSSVIAIPE